MSLEKYQSIVDLANQHGVSNLGVNDVNGILHIDGEAPSAEVKQALWDEYERIDPEFRSGDLVLNITAPGTGGPTVYTVEGGDSLSKIGKHFGVSWKAIFDANRDKLSDPDKIFPGQELTIPL